MMIYNTVDNPVVITIGDQTYRMERDSELEVKIPSGEYYFRMEQVDRKGRPMLTKCEYTGYGKSRKCVSCICMGMTALLRMWKNTKIYIREKTEPLFDTTFANYRQLTFDLEIDNGELTHRKDGCVDGSIGKQMKGSFKSNLIAVIIGCIAATVLGGIGVWMLLDGIREVGASSEVIGYLLCYLFVPIASVGIIIWNLGKVKQADVFDHLPTLPDRSYYDYL